jgi:hypothetical protein
LDFLELESSLDEDQQISQHPSWIIGVSRGVDECNILIFLGNPAEETGLELSERANYPLVAQLIGWRTWCCGALAFSRWSMNFLGQEEAMLSAVSAVSPGADLISKRSSLLSSQLVRSRSIDLLPYGVGMKSRERKPIRESVFLQVCEGENCKRREQGLNGVDSAIINGIPDLVT